MVDQRSGRPVIRAMPDGAGDPCAFCWAYRRRPDLRQTRPQLASSDGQWGPGDPLPVRESKRMANFNSSPNLDLDRGSHCNAVSIGEIRDASGSDRPWLDNLRLLLAIREQMRSWDLVRGTPTRLRGGVMGANSIMALSGGRPGWEFHPNGVRDPATGSKNPLTLSTGMTSSLTRESPQEGIRSEAHSGGL
ncbi:hypothetical protein R1flu_021818 [Riccia fluitans]|uniref:Uncharacterized protein n=1 Tax=Riccia fluitans TaxID=41844 RepID=A0ABD1ZS24_9MARC